MLNKKTIFGLLLISLNILGMNDNKDIDDSDQVQSVAIQNENTINHTSEWNDCSQASLFLSEDKSDNLAKALSDPYDFYNSNLEDYKYSNYAGVTKSLARKNDVETAACYIAISRSTNKYSDCQQKNDQTFKNTYEIIQERERLNSIYCFCPEIEEMMTSYYQKGLPKNIDLEVLRGKAYKEKYSSSITYDESFDNFPKLDLMGKDKEIQRFIKKEQGIDNELKDCLKFLGIMGKRLKDNTCYNREEALKTIFMSEKEVLKLRHTLHSTREQIRFFKQTYEMEKIKNKVEQDLPKGKKCRIICNTITGEYKIEAMDCTLDMRQTKKEGLSESRVNMSKEVRKIYREIENYSKVKEVHLNSDVQILEKITNLHENQVALNDAASEFSVEPNELDHQLALQDLMDSAKKVSNQNSLDKFKKREYDFSNIDKFFLDNVGLKESERFEKFTDLQDKMLHIVMDHVKDIDATILAYPDKVSINNLAQQHLNSLKEVVTCIKSNDMNKSITLLEKSWNLRGRTKGLCFSHDCIKISKALGKGVYSGAKRAINVPQRIVDTYHLTKELSIVFAKICEINELVEMGKTKEAELKYAILKQGFIDMWEQTKEKFNNASGQEIAFFVGELIGDLGTTKGLLFLGRTIKPKLVKGIKTCNKKVENCLEKFKKNPGKATVAKGSIEIEIGKKESKKTTKQISRMQKNIIKQHSQATTNLPKININIGEKVKSEVRRLAPKAAKIPGITIDKITGKIVIDHNKVSMQYSKRLQKLGFKKFAKSNLKHIRHGHYEDGSDYISKLLFKNERKSIFNHNENFVELTITACEKGTPITTGGETVFIFDFGRTIGVDITNKPTSIIQVCLNKNFDGIRTAFPIPMK